MLRFGKDVASIIWKIVWKCALTSINEEYHSSYTVSHGVLFAGRACFISVNDREPCMNHRFVYNMKTRKQVAEIPKNYWFIKELY